MATLGSKEKLFLLEQFAMFATLDEARKAYVEVFGKDIKRGNVWRYNANSSVARRELSDLHLEFFDEARKRFLDETLDIPIANKSYRLRALQKALDEAERRGAIGLVKDLTETAAKEMGGAYTNKAEITHSGKVDVPDSLTDEDRAGRVMALLERARARRSDGADGAE